MSATETLARFVVETGRDSLPGPVVEAAKVAILDGVANMLAGSTEPLADIVGGYVHEMGGTPESSVVGRGYRTSPPQAAFANGVFLHCLDFEVQGDPPTHGTSAALPPALALAEKVGAPGRSVVEAYVVGWEVQARLRASAASAGLRGFHPPGLFGPMGAAASSARVLGLDSHQVGMALGIAASHTGGLTANTGTMVKSTHPGDAARAGVEAALLAAAGFKSRDGILEAHQGYVDVLFGQTFDWELLTDGLGTTFRLVEPGFNIKRYPAYVYLQWAIEVVLSLRQTRNLRPDDVEYLELEVPPVRSDLSRPRPTSGLDGKFSFEYCAAVALSDGRVGIDSFTDSTRFSPRVEAALRKVRLRVNPDIPTELSRTWAAARARTRDGREYGETCRSYRGSIANPMDRSDRLAKFGECARRVLSADEIDRTVALVERLDDLEDVGELMGLVARRPTGPSAP